MDQVKVYLGVAKKHHFWILSAIVVITAVTVWMKASSTLATKYETDKRTIVDAEGSVQKANGPDVPNLSFSKKIDTLHEDLKKQVNDAWEELYKRQAALFTWPVLEVKGGQVDLSRFKPDEDIPSYLRTFYNENIVRNQWEDLLEQVQIRKPKPRSRTEDDEKDTDTEEIQTRGVEYEGLVVWKPERRQAIISRYYTPNDTPSTKRLRLMQEDFWLFDSLIKVVNAVNDGATDSLKAPIKEIDTLDVAQWAEAASVQAGAQLYVPGSNAGAAGNMGMTTGGMTTSTNSGMQGTSGATPNSSGTTGGGGGTTTPADTDKEWEEGRYLDEKGQPLPGENHPFAEFRQVFVYLKFVMDQRRIPDLVAACANAPLPVETRQVRVQLIKGDGAMAGAGGLFPMGGMQGGMGGMQGGMGGMQGGMGGMQGGMGGMQGGMMQGGAAGQMQGMMQGGMGGMQSGMGGMQGGMGSMQGGMGGMQGGMGAGPTGGNEIGGGGSAFGGLLDGGVETTVYDAVVELSGVVYLYNPPDIAKLGTGGASAPEKRSFGVPSTAARVPGTSGGGGGMMKGMSTTGSGQ